MGLNIMGLMLKWSPKGAFTRPCSLAIIQMSLDLHIWFLIPFTRSFEIEMPFSKVLVFSDYYSTKLPYKSPKQLYQENFYTQPCSHLSSQNRRRLVFTLWVSKILRCFKWCYKTFLTDMCFSNNGNLLKLRNVL